MFHDILYAPFKFNYTSWITNNNSIWRYVSSNYCSSTDNGSSPYMSTSKQGYINSNPNIFLYYYISITIIFIPPT